MNVIVFGSAGYNTLGVIRNLAHKSDIKTFLLLIKSSQMRATLMSNACKDYKIVKNAKEGITYLDKYFNSQEKAIILPTSDLAEYYLDKNYNLLKNRFTFPNAGKQGRVGELMDKILMTDIARKNGISVPYSLHYDKNSELPDTVPYPCIIKPLKSISGNKVDIKICQNRAELLEAINTSTHTQEFIIQQYIKREYDILLIGCRLLSGEIFLAGIFKKLRWVSNGEDGSWGIITNSIEEYIDKTKTIKFLQSLDYFGPFSIEYGVENNIPYFFEINLRNDGTSHYFNCLNINLPYTWIKGCINPHIDYTASKPTKEFYFIDEFGDFTNIMTTKLTFKQWRKDFNQAKVFKYFSKSDLLPFLFMAPRRIGKTLFLIIKNILNK